MQAASLVVMSAVLLGGTAPPTGSFTANDTSNLSNADLARALLGERLAAKVIEVDRHADDDDATSNVPTYVEFYTQPQLNTPRLNRICRVDVITVEYDFYEHDQIAPTTPLSIARIGATSRYKAFPEVPGEAGSADYDRAQAAECAKMKSAKDAFRAPTAGDAQWLAQIQTEYSDLSSQFKFTCEDFADRTCASARRQLTSLALNKADSVKKVDCLADGPGTR